MDENVALKKKNQNKFAKKVNKVQEQINKLPEEGVQTKKIKLSKPERGVVYVGHIPHGFYEKEMLPYFKQFGKISHIQLCRSKRTGRSKGYAFIQFADAEVAKIAADTMNNYLMFNRKLEAQYLKSDKLLKARKYKAPSWSENKHPLKVARKKVNMAKNKNIDEEKHLLKSKQIIKNVNKNLEKLKKLGINYNFQVKDIPKKLNDGDSKVNKDKSKNVKNEEDKKKVKQETSSIKSIEKKLTKDKSTEKRVIKGKKLSKN